LAGKAAQVLRVDRGCVENFEDLRVMYIGEISGRECHDSGKRFPSVSASIWE
jgi:hypothetical protein